MMEVDELIRPVLDHLCREDPGGLVGVYLYGSGATTGLRPDSDIDLLVLTRRSLTSAERISLVSMLLGVSGWSGHESQFPEVAGRRPLEVTSVVVDDVHPLMEKPRRDFQFGEWMRSELVDGVLPVPERDPDVVVLLSTALDSCRVLHGDPLQDVVLPVPPALFRRAQLALVPDVIDGVVGDERNALLMLARMVVTAESGQILPKHHAAERVRPRLEKAEADLLALAREEYLGTVRVDWAHEHDRTLGVVQALRRLVREAAEPREAGAPSVSTGQFGQGCLEYDAESRDV